CAHAGLRPLVATAWGSDLNWLILPEADAVVRKMTEKALQRLDLLIVDSIDMIDTAKKIGRRNIETLLLPIGIDTTLFRPGLVRERQRWRKRLQIAEDAILLLSPRAAAGHYRIAQIIEAYARMRRVRNSCLVVRLYNYGGERIKENLKRLASSLGISGNIRWVDEIPYDELPGLYAAADLAIN